MTKTYNGTQYADVKAATKTWGLFWEEWHMKGHEGNDVLIGGGDDDRIDGGTGIDRLEGKGGNDLYFVDNAQDTVIEKANDGFDTVKASVSYSLSENIESLHLTGNNHINGYGNSTANLMHGNNKDNAMYGYQGNDTMAGYDGHDRLDGGVGADTMIGGKNNDIYVVDNAGDYVSELWGEGYDTVEAQIDNYQLKNNFEALKLRSTPGVIKGRGNDQANSITGNLRDNELYGNDGSDTLKGYLGNDELFGGEGNDRLIGMHTTRNGEFDYLTGGGGSDAFQLYNFVNGNGYTYNTTSYAVLEDFSAFQSDKVWVLGSRSEYSLDTTYGDLLGGGGTDTLIYKGNNLVGVVENNTYVSLDRDFVFVAG